jgi:hypothetical protein
MNQKYVEMPVHNLAGVFFIKTVLETLDSVGGQALSEKDIHSVFSSFCNDYAITMSEKGGLAG